MCQRSEAAPALLLLCSAHGKLVGEMCGTPACFGGKRKVAGGAAAAAATTVRPRYVPRRGKVFRAVLGKLLNRPAKTRPLPR